MIKDLLKGFSFPRMGSFSVVPNSDKQGIIVFSCWNEHNGGIEISFTDLKRLMEHINAEHVAVSRISLEDNYHGEWQIVVKYRLF